MAFEIPHSCTLPTAERPVRLAEFDRLLGLAASTKRHGATHLSFSFPDADGTFDRALDLTARESSCCSFFDFEVARGAGRVLVGVRVPEQHADILDSLESRLTEEA